MKNGKYNSSKRVDFFAWRPISNATARCRGALYQKPLEGKGWCLRFLPPARDCIYQKLNTFKGPLKYPGKILLLLIVLFVRLVQVFSAKNADVVIIQRELFSVGPPFLERILKIVNPRIVYDFDDVLNARPPYGGMSYLDSYKKDKFASITSLANHLLPSTEYLASKCSGSSLPITVLPTPVDIDKFNSVTRVRTDAVHAVGWVGTGGNQCYLEAVVPALRKIQAQYDCPFVVVSEYDFCVQELNVINFRWTLTEEASIMQKFHIGIMPLDDSDYARGKAGYKILQYWAAGLPVVASPVGFNAVLVEHGRDGFLAETEEEWVRYLTLLLQSPSLRAELGTAGHRKVKDNFSPDALVATLARGLDAVALRRA